MSVHRLLVSATDEQQLFQFHIPVGFVANAIERRGNRVLYTVMDEDLEGVLAVARHVGVTVQKRVKDWEMVHKGTARPYRKRKPAPPAVAPGGEP